MATQPLPATLNAFTEPLPFRLNASTVLVDSLANFEIQTSK